MDSRKNSHVKHPKRKDPERSFFDSMIGSSVTLEDLGGKQFGGKLIWVEPYSLKVDRKGTEVMYWKHALRSIRRADGRSDDSEGGSR